MKAQAAMEYLIMAGVVLGAAIIIFYYTVSYSTESIAVSQAGECAETLANAVDYVYALGPGTQTVVEIDIPSNAVECEVGKVICAGGDEIGLKISTSAGVSDVYAVTKVSPSGGIVYTTGRTYVLVKHNDTGVFIATP